MNLSLLIPQDYFLTFTALPVALFMLGSLLAIFITLDKQENQNKVFFDSLKLLGSRIDDLEKILVEKQFELLALQHQNEEQAQEFQRIHKTIFNQNRLLEKIRVQDLQEATNTTPILPDQF